MAAFLAGREMLLHDGLPDSDSIAMEVERIEPLVLEISNLDSEEGEGMLCLNHLYTSSATFWRGGDMVTVSHMILKGMASSGEAEGHRNALEQIGVKLRRVPGKEAGAQEWALLISNNHQGLERFYRNTRWQGKAWVTALRYLPGTLAWPTPMRFAGMLSRATRIPPEHLPTANTAEAVTEAADNDIPPL